MDLSRYVSAVLWAMTTLPAIRDRSVVRSLVIAATKYSCSGSLLRLLKGRTMIDSLAGTARSDRHPKEVNRLTPHPVAVTTASNTRPAARVRTGHLTGL